MCVFVLGKGSLEEIFWDDDVVKRKIIDVTSHEVSEYVMCYYILTWEKLNYFLEGD